MTEQAYPLSWPAAWPRTPSYQKKTAQFGKTVQSSQGSWKTKARLSIADATRRLLDELGRLGAEGIIISSNLRLRRDGYPASDQREPDDNGVAVYFELLDKPQVLACDRWDKVADNIAALAGMAQWAREHFGMAR